MKALYSFLVVIGLTLGGVAAQEARIYPYKTIEYIAADNRKLPGPEGAERRVESTFRDSISGSVRVYNAAGKLLVSTPYAHMQAGLKLGPETSFYETGELHTKEDFVGNKRNGEFVVFYKDGKVKRREKYQNDVKTGAECFAPDGSPVPYFDYEAMPRYKGGGLDEMVKAIQMSVKYPMEDLRRQIEGKVYVSFAVGTDGQMQEVKIVKGLSGTLDAEVIRAVRTLRNLTPGMQDGEPVKVSFTAPITFAIQ